MFALFFSLYLAMFRGAWLNVSLINIRNAMPPVFNKLGEVITSLFNNVDTPVSNLGTSLFSPTTIQGVDIENYLYLIAFILALITSISIVVMAIKVIKRVFSVFFTLGR